MPNVLITGAAGFIGYHLAKLLLKHNWNVLGIDCFSDYYDVALKRARASDLLKAKCFKLCEGRVEDQKFMLEKFSTFRPDVVIHLAAQAGVRYSIDFPEEYITTNVVGTFQLLELVKKFQVKHTLMASTSSVYGANETMPFFEVDKTEHQMSLYAATKKSNEVMAHSYSHLFGLPITMFRFFTVYGPWGRPDMALFKFTKNILNDQPIDIYNYGKMRRDFTYVNDLVESIKRLIDAVPERPGSRNKTFEHDSISPVAAWRVVNIGNSDSVELMEYVSALEEALEKRAKKNFMEIQPGDVPETLANTDLLFELTRYKPNTSIKDGIKNFTDWYKNYYL